jgi:hypothetical protein
MADWKNARHTLEGEKMEAKDHDPPARFETGNLRTGAIGLDVGTSRIVVADGPGKKAYRSELNAFVAVPNSKMAENMLRQRDMAYEYNPKSLYVYGNDSDFFTSFLDTNARRPMQYGLLNRQEELSQQMIQLVIKRLLPTARKNEALCFSVPGKGEVVNENLVYHEAVLKSFLRSLGYNAKAVNEGQAVVFSELQEENFTGIGISFGGGLCNVSVSFIAMPVITFSVPKGGDYIDRSAAEAMGETNITRVRLYKEEHLDLARPAKDELSNALHIFYEDVLRNLMDRLRLEFTRAGKLPMIDRPVPIVLAGGTSMPRGFMQKFESMLSAGEEFPIRISDIRMAADPLDATARGCYIAAMSEAG